MNTIVLCQFTGQRLQALAPPGYQHQMEPLRGKLAGKFRANAAGGPSNDCGFAGSGLQPRPIPGSPQVVAQSIHHGCLPEVSMLNTKPFGPQLSALSQMIPLP